MLLLYPTDTTQIPNKKITKNKNKKSHTQTYINISIFHTAEFMTYWKTVNMSLNHTLTSAKLHVFWDWLWNNV